jgi:uncharacterized protein YkwD
MPISFLCPCRKPLQALDADAGKQVRCPACNRILLIPGKGPVPPPAPMSWLVPGRTGGPPPAPAVFSTPPARKGWLVGVVALLLVGAAAFSLTAWWLDRNRTPAPSQPAGKQVAQAPKHPAAKNPVAPKATQDGPKKEPDRAGPIPPLPVPDPRPKKPTPIRPARDDVASRALERINAFRTTAGLPPVIMDPRLSRGCMAHAEYVLKNLGNNDTVHSDLLRTEDPKRPGYSDEGLQAARNSITGLDARDPLAPFGRWMAMLFARLDLLSPNLQRIGFGHAHDEEQGWVSVLDIYRGTGSDRVMIYPVPGQKGVPLRYPGSETPDPIPQARVKKAGYPITVTFPQGQRVRDVKVTLVADPDGEVEAWVSTPQKPAFKPAYQMNTVCVIAKAPLRPETEYTVTLAATVSGKPWRQTWSFTTAPSDEEGMPAGANVLEKVNAYRKICGLAPVTLDPDLSRGCTLHAQYLVKNSDHPSTRGLGAHEEDASLPGYTPEGKRAGQSSVIHHGARLEQSVDSWMATFFHRLPFLDPNLKRMGYGHARGGRWGWVAVMDYQNGKGINQPAFYPNDGQTKVPCAYRRGEIPSPIPKGRRAGYPITVLFPESAAVKNVTARLEAAGEEVPVWLSTAENSVQPELQRNTVALIARAPLKPETTYTVTVAAEVRGKAWTRTWKFTTGKR